MYTAAIGLAVEGIIDGAGWAIKELQDQVYDPGTQEQLQGEGWCADDWPKHCAPVPSDLIALGKSLGMDRGGRWYYEEATPKSGYIMQRGPTGLYSFFSVTLRQRPATGWDGYNNWAVGTAPSPVTDGQLGDAIRQNPDLVNSLLTDPRTGRPVMTPELQQQMDDLRRKIEDREGFPTGTPSPAPNLEDDTASDQGSPWPSFCGWATTVCDFIAWFKGDGGKDVDLPETELDIQPSQWSSGISGGSCPVAASITVGVLGTTGDVSFDWQPLCSLATSLRPFLIAICMMVGAFIVAGLRKSAV